MYYYNTVLGVAICDYYELPKTLTTETQPTPETAA